MEFREIDKSNYWDCIALTIDDMLYRTRQSLKAYLEKEGFDL